MAATLSVFGSDPNKPVEDDPDREADDAHNELLLLMGRVGRGEISVEEAKALYGDDLSGVVKPSAAPQIQPEEQGVGGDLTQF